MAGFNLSSGTVCRTRVSPSVNGVIIYFIIILLSHLLFPATAAAQMKLPFSFKEEVSPVFDLPDSQFDGKDVGYQYTSFRLFSVPIYVLEGRLVLYDENSVVDLAGPELERLESAHGSMHSRVSLWLRFGNYFFLLLYIVVFVFIIKRHFDQE